MEVSPCEARILWCASLGTTRKPDGASDRANAWRGLGGRASTVRAEEGLVGLDGQRHSGQHKIRRSLGLEPDGDAAGPMGRVRCRQIPKPESEWVVVEDEALRIISQALWDRVQGIRQSLKRAWRRRSGRRSAKEVSALWNKGATRRSREENR